MTSVSERRERVVLGPLPPSFLRLETPTSDGDASLTADPATGRQVDLPPAQQPPTTGAQPPTSGAQPPTQQPRPMNAGQPAPQNTPYTPQAGLSITVAQAVLNKSYTLIGSMDPYVRLKVGHNTYETFTHGGADKSPCWNKVYHCPLPNTHSVRTVSVEIFDEKALTEDQRIAYAKISVPDSVFQGHTLDEWFPLSGKLGEGKEGSINLIISYTTMPMITLPYQRIHYPYQVAAPQHFTPPPPPEIKESDVTAIKDMFPEVDKEVIRTVLESKHGNLDSAVAAILEIMGDGSNQTQN